MAKLPTEVAETIWILKRQLLEIVDAATAVEDTLFSTQNSDGARRTKTSFRAGHTLVFSIIKPANPYC
jgi:hypothetical protein